MLLIASTGFNREAKYAGINPKMNPIKNDTVTPINILSCDNTKFILKEDERISVPVNTNNKPNIPPINDKIIASKIN